ncbi:PepSY-like domain-containing protein [uncultured Draconibacterium sp.]|uniref:PepSY-like domain-containing protein n=1 Tax=uncultured Draconibacterium sp. TaxID=1573823 RepID=UPI0029C8FE2B|nr:PepSY-like domain-containing protein [uncultured Draconibacterium sp.]
MKQSVFMVAVLAVSLIACAQTPPQSVADTFNSKFSGATKVKWDQEEENGWEAEFIMDNSEISASFNDDGTWLETESEINETDLPTAVKAKLAMNYWGYEMEGVEKIEKPGFFGYEIAIEKGDEELEIQISDDCKIIRSKDIEEDED